MFDELITPPVSELLDVTDLKTYLRVDPDLSDDDALIASLIAAGRVKIEDYLGYALTTQTRRLTLSAWPRSYDLSLPRPPLQGVSSVLYGPDDTPLDPAGYRVDTHQRPGRMALVDGASWPDAPPGAPGIRITYICGFIDLATLPPVFVTAWRLLVAHWYENREAAVASTVRRAEVEKVPYGVEYLLDPYRIV